MSKEELEIKALFFDIYNEKDRVDSLFDKIISNYQRTIEEGGNSILFWVRDKETVNLKTTVDSLKTSIERLSESVDSLLEERNKMLKRSS